MNKEQGWHFEGTIGSFGARAWIVGYGKTRNYFESHLRTLKIEINRFSIW